MSKDYQALPLAEFIADTALKSPTPGGGSVAAVVGAMAAALGHMALVYTAGKPAYAAHEECLRRTLAELHRSSGDFMRLMQEDMAAYEEYAAARKSGDPDRQRVALDRATAVPMEMITLADAVGANLDEVKACTNPQLFSDLQAAAILIAAAARAAATSAVVNLKMLPDRKEAERLDDRLSLMLARLSRHCDAVTHYQAAP
ncbi:MAG: cyclodeaminase/cyclohydrolase family protein [Phycisphaerae bacterium]|nr:cyclodeaminase/cyclohydrolase family protein [Phycisphaerae bacterium]